MLRGVLFDWRGTLVAALDAASRLPEIEAQMHDIDCSAEHHRAVSMEWFRGAGLDEQLASVLYDLDFEAENHPFFPDVAETLHTLRATGVAVSVVSDIHFDLRPEFAAAGLDDFVDSFVLSFEHSVQKPSAAIFGIAAESLAIEPEELLMVGDRASHDGGAVQLGITTLLLPPLRTADGPRNLAAVLALIDAGQHS